MPTGAAVESRCNFITGTSWQPVLVLFSPGLLLPIIKPSKNRYVLITGTSRGRSGHRDSTAVENHYRIYNLRILYLNMQTCRLMQEDAIELIRLHYRIEGFSSHQLCDEAFWRL